MRRIVFGALLLAACSEQDTTTERRELTAECARDRATLPSDAWVCGEERTLECDSHQGADLDFIYVIEPRTELSCFGTDYELNNTGPFAEGDHQIEVTRLSNGDTCTSELHVVDTTVPEVSPQNVPLWPPNHKFHTISTDACAPATDICDDDVDVEFTYIASDEPVNATGDGNSDPDVIFDNCDEIQIRAERRGNSDGRFYTLGWRAIDNSGNETTGECWVTISHDQSGRPPIDSGTAYRVDAPAECLESEHRNNNSGV